MNYLKLFCCEEYQDLCVIISKCKTSINTGLLATQNGIHIVYLKHGNSIIEQTFNLSIGDELIIKNVFKRLGTVIFAIQQPDNTITKCYTYSANNIKTVEQGNEEMPITAILVEQLNSVSCPNTCSNCPAVYQPCVNIINQTCNEC